MSQDGREASGTGNYLLDTHLHCGPVPTVTSELASMGALRLTRVTLSKVTQPGRGLGESQSQICETAALRLSPHPVPVLFEG